MSSARFLRKYQKQKNKTRRRKRINNNNNSTTHKDLQQRIFFKTSPVSSYCVVIVILKWTIWNIIYYTNEAIFLFNRIIIKSYCSLIPTSRGHKHAHITHNCISLCILAFNLLFGPTLNRNKMQCDQIPFWPIRFSAKHQAVDSIFRCIDYLVHLLDGICNSIFRLIHIKYTNVIKENNINTIKTNGKKESQIEK